MAAYDNDTSDRQASAVILEVAKWLSESSNSVTGQAWAAQLELEAFQKEDPRNDSDYDTFPYGTEPIPGDTTWGEK
jgi:hypothetical protein